MGLFGDKEEKQRDKAQAREEFIRTFTDKYNLDAVSDKDVKVMLNIALEAWEKGKHDGVLSNVIDVCIHEELKAIEGQNWMILNQLNKLNSNFEKLFNR